jgi:hypothetical protein
MSWFSSKKSTLEKIPEGGTQSETSPGKKLHSPITREEINRNRSLLKNKYGSDQPNKLIIQSEPTPKSNSPAGIQNRYHSQDNSPLIEIAIPTTS